MVEKSSVLKEYLDEGKRKFNQGLVSESIDFLENLLAKKDDPVIANKASKAMIEVELARKLIEVELFPKAESVLTKAATDIGEVGQSSETDIAIAFWKIRYTLGKLQFRSMYQ